jgi:hypothetical protein
MFVTLVIETVIVSAIVIVIVTVTVMLSVMRAALEETRRRPPGRPADTARSPNTAKQRQWTTSSRDGCSPPTTTTTTSPLTHKLSVRCVHSLRTERPIGPLPQLFVVVFRRHHTALSDTRSFFHAVFRVKHHCIIGLSIPSQRCHGR